jgi:ribonuclease BN (tRNA processing enzyme)
MKLTFLGSGDAFGTGGRFNTCFHVQGETGAFLIDCGASSLVAMRKAGISPNDVRTIFLTHLHGDHFGGLPFLILDAQLAGRRSSPLTVVGPRGLQDRLREAQEALFPRSSQIALRYELELIEIAPGQPQAVGGVTVRATQASHFSGSPSLSLRLETEGRAIAYSGDTAWTEALIEAAHGADLFICEAYFRGRKVSGHMDVDDLLPRLREIDARRVVLTHMGAEMLAADTPPGVTKAFDGLEIEL